MGDPRSPAMSPFDRAPTTSISTLIETLHLSFYLVPFSSYSELFVESHLFLPTPPAFGASIGDDAI